VIRLEEWVDIVSMHRQGLSIRAIARRLGVSRNTVWAALRRDGLLVNRKTVYRILKLKRLVSVTSAGTPPVRECGG